MKSWIYFCLILFMQSAYAVRSPISYNLDIFRCGKSYKTLFEVENALRLYQAENVDLKIQNIATFADALREVSKNLNNYMPARVKFIEELLSSSNENVFFKSGQKIVRSSPESNLVLPDGCEVLPIASIEIDYFKYKVVINQDIFEELSIEGRIYLVINLALDIEQGIFKFMSANDSRDVEINQVQGREFLACWFSSQCRPKSLGEFHSLVRKSPYNFLILEQDGILIPNFAYNKISFDENTGLVKSTLNIVHSYIQDSTAYRSTAQINGEKYPVLVDNFIKFNQDGKVQCANLVRDFIFEERIELPKTQFFGRIIEWEGLSNSGYILNFPFCVNGKGQVKQGGITFSDTTPFRIKIGENTFNINTYDPLAENAQAGLIFYDDYKVNWIVSVHETVLFNSQKISIDGHIKFYPTGKIECFSAKKSVKLRTPDQKIINIMVDPNKNRSDLFCFSEEGNLKKTYPEFESTNVFRSSLEKF